MQESQYKIYNDIQNILNQNLSNNKTKALTTLAYIILSGNKYSIDFYVKMAIRYGATYRDFLKVFSCIIGNMRLLDSIIELLRIINNIFKKEEI